MIEMICIKVCSKPQAKDPGVSKETMGGVAKDLASEAGYASTDDSFVLPRNTAILITARG